MEDGGDNVRTEVGGGMEWRKAPHIMHVHSKCVTKTHHLISSSHTQ